MMTVKAELPPRFGTPRLFSLVVWGLSIVFVGYAFVGAEFSIDAIQNSFPAMQSLLLEMLPPDFSNISRITEQLFETFQMAVVGTLFGVMVSLPLGFLASKEHAPHRIIYHITRSLVSFMRTVPDLIWALFFVATVGLGPFAGVLTLIVDTVGFCGRFFAESLEEVDKRPQEALRVLGAGRGAIFICAAMPAAFPSFLNTSLFCLEKATRSSVVLGLVGAGGIGIELKNAMETWRYPEAATIILLIFCMVILVEQASSFLRSKVL